MSLDLKLETGIFTFFKGEKKGEESYATFNIFSFNAL